VTDQALGELVRGWTREAGVRNLEREVAGLCRKVARRKAEGTLEGTARIGTAELPAMLGPMRYVDSPLERRSRVGVANGLAWTESGGDLLTIEVSVLPGKGDLQLTGKLGDVMRESGPGGDVVRARPRHAPGARPLVPPRHRRARARARGCDAEGRPVGRHHHGHGGRLRAHRRAHAQRRGDDRRDHAPRQRAADRRDSPRSSWPRVAPACASCWCRAATRRT
jgi:hypothetical protein